MKTYFGIKMGMTQAWTTSGLRLPVSIIKAAPMVVTQVKQNATDGYTAVQVGIGTRRAKTMTNPELHHVEKSKATPRTLKEIRLSEPATEAIGDQVTIDQVVKLGDIVKVSGVTIGKGFAGVMKRWGFHGGPKTHGQSDRWRAPGSIGQGTNPGRVRKGKKMAGHDGDFMFTVRNLQIIKIDTANQEVWVNGPIPGARKAVIEIEVTKEGKFEGLREVETLTASVPETTTENN